MIKIRKDFSNKQVFLINHFLNKIETFKIYFDDSLDKETISEFFKKDIDNLKFLLFEERADKNEI